MAVNLSPVAGAAAQFFDNSGNVLTGGKLYTYDAGTTTPAPTYTTSSGAVAQPNPIVLNAAGRVPDSGEIWLSDSVSYKFVLKDSNDVLIGTYDNLVGINSNFVNFTGEEETQTATQGQTIFTLTTLTYQPATNNLLVFVNGSKQVPVTNYVETSSTVITFVDGLNVGDVVDFCTATPINTSVVTADQVSYNEGSIGATNRTVETRLQDYVSVKDFGAVGDGTTDDTAAFNAAILAQDGGSLYIPEGNYLITAGLDAIDSTINIFGSGKDSAKITFTPSVADEILFDVYKAGPGVLDRFSLGGFAVYGGSANKLTYLRIDNISGGVFYDLEFNGGGNSATNSIGMDLKGREACSFTNISLFNMGQPIVVNAGVSGGIDHFNFSNLYITVSANPPLYPLFKVNAGAVTSNISFTGYQAWVGGLGAFDHAGTSGINILFQSLRYETAGVVVADANIVPTFKFNPSSAITGITFSNCYVSSIEPATVTTKTTDLYFRNCVQININNTSVSHADSGHIANWIDADNTCDEIFVANLLDTPGGHGYEVLGSNLIDVCSTKGIETGPPTAPPNRIIIKKTAVGGINPFPAQLLGNAYFWSSVTSVENDATVTIAGFASSLTQYLIAFSDNETPEVIYGGGQFMVSGPNYAGTPNQQSVKLSGTSNIVNNSGATAGQVGVYKDTATPDVKVINKTGVTITLSVIAMYSES